MESNRELLELAAKAAGIVLHPHPIGAPIRIVSVSGDVESGCEWNPQADDGDALRLAVRLRILHWIRDGHAYVEWHISNNARQQLDVSCARFKGDECAAIRNLIVRAAAAIGKEQAK